MSTKIGRAYIEDVASRLDTATDDELGRAMAETARCFRYGPKVPPCRERPLMKDRCARCSVRMESDRRIAKDEASRSKITMNIDVVFPLVGVQSYEATSVLDIDVQAPAQAGVAVLREPPPATGSGPWPGNAVTFWRGDLVAWWRPCPEAEAQAFELCTNGAVTRDISHTNAAIGPWLKMNKAKILVEAERHAKAVRARLVKHVKAQLAEHQRLADEAQDLKLEKEAALEAEGAHPILAQKNAALDEQERFDASEAEELGRMLLSWSGIKPEDAAGVREFIESVQHSTIPDAAGDIGFAITSARKSAKKRRRS